MAMTIGVGALIGVALGLRFNVFFLIATTILVPHCNNHSCGGQYRCDSSRARRPSVVYSRNYRFGGDNTSNRLFGWDCRTRGFDKLAPLEGNDLTLNILRHMEVVGSDGEHVGTVDHAESADRVVLTGDDPEAGGKPHVISVERRQQSPT